MMSYWLLGIGPTSTICPAVVRQHNAQIQASMRLAYGYRKHHRAGAQYLEQLANLTDKTWVEQHSLLCFVHQ